MKRRATRMKASPRKRISRRALDMTIRDLAGRLKKIEVEAQAFAKLIEPNSEHAVIEHQIRAACGVLLNSLQHRISSASGLADLLVREQEAA